MQKATRNFLRVGSALLVALVATASPAKTGYVTDQYEFNLRSGESTRYKILRQLPSGTPLTIIDVNEESGYARVQTEDGLTGFMLLRYLQDEPAARSELEAARARLTELQQEPDKLAAQLNALRDEHELLQENAASLKREKQNLESELAEIRNASANAIEIDRERRQLQERVANLLVQVDQLEHRNLELANRTKQHWFLIGAAVLAGGVLVGLLLPNLRLRRRRSPWGGSSL
jgi:SH3 domain protein